MRASSHGRGSKSNPPNRFERIVLEPDPDWNASEDPGASTQFFKDSSETLIAHNDSPDIPFSASINPYRGCEHGCAYCYARPTHEYLGFSAGLDFESRIMVKERAPELLRRELASRNWKPQVLAMSGVTDPYQPIERRLGLTRRCLEVLAEFRNPVGIITKSHLVTRDIDLLSNLAEHRAVAVNISLTSLDAALLRKLEPRAASPDHRLRAIRELKDAGVPAGILMAPIIPGLTDHEIPSLLAAAAAAGARWAGFVLLRLPLGVGPLFEAWLAEHSPDRMDKVLGRLREIRGGKLNDPRFGSRMRGEGLFAQQIEQLFSVSRRRCGLMDTGPELSIASFRKPPGAQLELFSETTRFS